jgi:transport family protein 27
MEQRRLINPSSAKQLADSLNIKYFECSAKENNNVIDPFKHLATEYVKKYKESVSALKSILD